jgi:hypothetical protein
MFPKGEYHALNGVSPFWQSASQPAQDDEVTLLTTISAESWKELVALAENWNGKKKKDILSGSYHPQPNLLFRPYFCHTSRLKSKPSEYHE